MVVSRVAEKVGKLADLKVASKAEKKVAMMAVLWVD